MMRSNLKNYQPLIADVYSFKRFGGNYVVTCVVAKTDALNRGYRLITVSDGSGDLCVKCTNFELLGVDLTLNSMVYIEAALNQREGEAEFYCKNLIPISNCKRLGPDLSFLPRSICPFPEVFDGLLIMAERVREKLLREFLRQVLLKPDVGLLYLQCPASLNYHHNYRGGLVKHSVSVAWNIFGILDLNSLDRDIAVVAALLHDIGKIKTLTPDMKRTAVGRLVDHAPLALEICAEPLAELESRAPGIAFQLRHAWTCFSPRARYGFKPKTAVAKYLQYVDNMSSTRQKWTTPDFREQSYKWMHSTRSINTSN